MKRRLVAAGLLSGTLAALGIAKPDESSSISRTIKGFVDENTSPEQVATRIETHLKNQAKEVLEAQVAAQHHQQEIAHAQARRVTLVADQGQLRQQMAFLRECLRKPGDTISPIAGVCVPRKDAERDLAVMLDRFREVAAEVASLDREIEHGQHDAHTIRREIGEARAKIATNASWLRGRELDLHRAEIRHLTDSTRDGSAIESLVAGVDEVDADKRLLERKLPVAVDGLSVEQPWKMWAAGHATEGDAFLSEVDAVLGGSPSAETAQVATDR